MSQGDARDARLRRRSRTVVGCTLVGILLAPLVWSLLSKGGFGRDAAVVGVVEVTGVISLLAERPWDEQGDVGFVLEQLAQARQAPEIRALVVRINSGGGSAAASQELHRAILRVRQAGKPVVISMAETAASGGYYVAVAGDRILANPATVTGSIGVIVQYPNFAGLSERVGFTYETVKTGEFKDTGNPTRAMTARERAVIQELVDDTLDQFVEAIAAGRGLNPETVRRIADGRVLTGRQALELGLIDGFGGLEEAIELAAELAGIEEPEVRRFRRDAPWYVKLLSGIFLPTRADWPRLLP